MEKQEQMRVKVRKDLGEELYVLLKIEKEAWSRRD